MQEEVAVFSNSAVDRARLRQIPDLRVRLVGRDDELDAGLAIVECADISSPGLLEVRLGQTGDVSFTACDIEALPVNHPLPGARDTRSFGAQLARVIPETANIVTQSDWELMTTLLIRSFPNPSDIYQGAWIGLNAIDSPNQPTPSTPGIGATGWRWADELDRNGEFATADRSRLLPVIDLVNHGAALNLTLTIPSLVPNVRAGSSGARHA